MHVLITGASGFIGRAVTRKARAAGWRVTAVSRHPSAGADLVADLRRPIGDWAGPDAVIHLAGGYAGASAQELAGTDLTIARNLIEWGHRQGTPRWILASAAEVYGPIAGEADENCPCRPAIPYGAAKLAMERMFQSAEFPELSICRLGEVYGREGRILREIPARLRLGFCPWPGNGEVPVSFLHVDDAAAALVAACARAAPGCAIYNVGDRQPATWRQFLDRIASALGTRRATFLPYALARLYAAFEWRRDRLLGRAEAVTPAIVRLLTTPKALSSARIRERLGFTPRYAGIDSGLEEALRAL